MHASERSPRGWVSRSRCRETHRKTKITLEEGKALASGCQSGFVCVGRSPLHPYSVCVNEKGATCQRDVLPSCMDLFADRRCLTFKVDEPSQPVADAHSLCVDRAICDAAAQAYPGGAFCTGGK